MTDSKECHPISRFSFRKSVDLGEATLLGNAASASSFEVWTTVSAEPHRCAPC